MKLVIGVMVVVALLNPETVGTLPDVEILGIHYTKVRPERRPPHFKYGPYPSIVWEHR